jgi:hypothetical protein
MILIKADDVVKDCDITHAQRIMGNGILMTFSFHHVGITTSWKLKSTVVD